MNNSRIDQLTWLRGIAAFLVIVSHSIRATEVKYAEIDEPSYFLPLSLLDLGSFGVALFFVLSGCTLWISNKGFRKKNDILVFYIKRFFRIWPAFFVSILIYIVFIQIFKYLYTNPKGYPIEFLLNDDFSLLNVFQYLSLSFNITGPRGIINGAYWSLPVEFQFYLTFPILVAIIYAFGILGLVIISVLFYMYSLYPIIPFDKYEVFNLSYTFFFGTLVGYLYTENKIKIRFNMFQCAILLSLCFGIASAVYNNFIPIPVSMLIVDQKWNWYGVMAILSVFVMLNTNFNVKPSKLVEFLREYGEISYSTYLYHNIFTGMSVLIIINFGLYGDSPKLFFTFLFTLICSYITARYLYKYVELPGIKAGRYFITKITKINQQTINRAQTSKP